MENEETKDEFRPRDPYFYISIGAISIAAGLLGVINHGPGIIPSLLCAVGGGMNLGVVIESRRWQKRKTGDGSPQVQQAGS